MNSSNIPATGDGSATAMARPTTAVTMLRVTGSVAVNAGGMFTRRWTQNVSSASATTVQVGGAMNLTSVAVP